MTQNDEHRVEQKKSPWWPPKRETTLWIFTALIAVVTLIVFRSYYPERLHGLPTLVGAGFVILTAILWLIFIGQSYEWTGFGESSYPKSDSREIQPRKTLWDWLQLLIIPAFLTFYVLYWSTTQEDARQQQIEAQRAKIQQVLAEQQAQDEALQAYLDVMKELLLEQDLRDSGPDSNARAVANVQTSLILDRVDARRKTSVLRLLTDAHLIDADAPLIETSTLALQGADARGMDLSDTDLSDTDLSHANLEDAMMEGANLSRVNLSHADLREADLSGADLSESNLRQANLSGAVGISAEELEQESRSIAGATMPNGQKYED